MLHRILRAKFLIDDGEASQALRILASQIESKESKADVAQLVEQPIRNRQVTGSSPVVGSRTRCRVSFPAQKDLCEPDSYLFIHRNLF